MKLRPNHSQLVAGSTNIGPESALMVDGGSPTNSLKELLYKADLYQ